MSDKKTSGLDELDSKIDPYDLDPEFERIVVTLFCGNAQFFNDFHAWVDPDLFHSRAAKEASRAAKEIYQETERPPGSCAVVRQKLTEKRRLGKIEQVQIDEIIDLFEDAQDAGLPDLAVVRDRVTAVIQRDVRRALVEEMILELKPGKGDFQSKLEKFQRVERIGKEDYSYGTVMGKAAWDSVAALRHAERMELGVEALDGELEGGINRGGLFVWMAETGGGKSMACSHTGTHNFLAGAHVLYASMELPEGEVWARVFANATGIKIRDIKNGTGTAEAERILAQRQGSYGRMVIKEFTAYATMVDDVVDWVRREEDRAHRKVDLLIVDPADRMAAPKEKSDYTAARVIYDGLRAFVHGQKIFGLTACHVTRKKQGRDGRKLIGINDAADSMHKMRIVDGVISINLLEEEGSADKGIIFYIAKHRAGPGQGNKVGPMQPDYAHGRLIWHQDASADTGGW